jgi:hypothetical protein
MKQGRMEIRPHDSVTQGRLNEQGRMAIRLDRETRENFSRLSRVS